MIDVKQLAYANFSKTLEKLPLWLSKSIVSILKRLFCEEKFRAISNGNEHLTGLDFTDNLLEKLNISYTVKPAQLKNIPTTGKLIIIANHITGMQDTFSLVQLIANVREDKKVKIIINSMMSELPHNFGWSIPVDVAGAITKNSLKEIYNSLDNDEAIIIFPAGFVNRFSFLNGIKDIDWKASFLKIAQKSSTPILPIKIDGRNSILFYLASIILPNKISAFLLPREFANAQTRKPLSITIGKIIPVKSFNNKNIPTKKYLDLFYKHLYSLDNGNNEVLETETTIGEAKNRKILKDEIKQAEYLGTTNDGKKIILAKADESPFLLKELGRVREISFRAIGGGTGSSHDNDLYDNYYKHLILWDDEEMEIVGAYRIGECKNIIEQKGKEGLYTYNLCNFSKHFEEYCNFSVELGRSFIQPKYWGSRALDSLWQGVGAYLAHHNEIQYTYGVVTINADTPPKAVAALVYFYSLHFSCNTNMMQAKTPYIMSIENKNEFDKLFNGLSYKDGFAVLKSYLKNLNTIVPTLFKQYTELYEEGAVRFFDFSVNDNLFGVVEGFIIADNTRMIKAKRKRYIENYEKLQIMDSTTNLFNKAHFNNMINTITKYQRKHDVDFVLVMVKINDYNLVDEQTLVKIAATLKKSLRGNDIIAKWDNDEFIFILKNVTVDESMMILSKLKESMINATCSYGATKYKAPESINDTFMRAKDALTEANNCDVHKVVIQN